MFNKQLKHDLNNAVYEINCLKQRAITSNDTLQSLRDEVKLQKEEIKGLHKKLIYTGHCIQQGHNFTIINITQIGPGSAKAEMNCFNCGYALVRDATPVEIKAWETLHPSR